MVKETKEKRVGTTKTQNVMWENLDINQQYQDLKMQSWNMDFQSTLPNLSNQKNY